MKYYWFDDFSRQELEFAGASKITACYWDWSHRTLRLGHKEFASSGHAFEADESIVSFIFLQKSLKPVELSENDFNALINYRELKCSQSQMRPFIDLTNETLNF